MKTGIEIHGGKGTAFQQRLLTILGQRLEQAITLGRDAVAIEIAHNMRELGGVKNVSITNCQVGDFAK